MSAKEIVTIQCGHFSNHIGTHWWNLQQSQFSSKQNADNCNAILHDCTFREGLTLTGQQTYTPRLIAFDLYGSLSTLKEEGELYTIKTPEKTLAWQGSTSLHGSEPPPKNELLLDMDKAEEEVNPEVKGQSTNQPSQTQKQQQQQGLDVEPKSYHLDDSVGAWSDFLCLHLHPKSLVMVPGQFHNDDSFNTYPSGQEVWSSKKLRQTFEDRLHFFVEECDHLQGFQILSDWSDGFAGLAGCLVQDLTDEFGSKGLTVTISSPSSSPLDSLPTTFYPNLFNHLLALNDLSQHSSLLCPLSLLPHLWRGPSLIRKLHPLTINPSLLYHSSAVFAAALDTVSLMYRTEHSIMSLAELCGYLANMGRKISSLGISLSLDLPEGGTLSDHLSLSPIPSSLSPLTPYTTTEDRRWSQAICMRGIPPNYPLSQHPQFSSSQNPSHILAAHLYETSPSINSQLCYVDQPMPLTTPYPHILPPHIMAGGHSSSCASLSSSSGTHHLISSLLTEVSRANRRLHPSYCSEGCLDDDGTAEVVQNLSALAECYNVGTTDSSDTTDSD